MWWGFSKNKLKNNFLVVMDYLRRIKMAFIKKNSERTPLHDPPPLHMYTVTSCSGFIYMRMYIKELGNPLKTQKKPPVFFLFKQTAKIKKRKIFHLFCFCFLTRSGHRVFFLAFILVHSFCYYVHMHKTMVREFLRKDFDC